MKIRNKYYPYPVLTQDDSGYIDSSFVTRLEQSMDGYDIKLKFNAELVNIELEDMLKDGDISIVYHIECPQTCYRNIINTSSFEEEIILSSGDINGVIEVCSFLVAQKDIYKYSNQKFNQDYRGFKFNIYKGCIIAVGNQFKIRINKIKDDLKNATSIFSVIPNMDDKENKMFVSLNTNKIVISLPEKNYQQYYNSQGNMEIQPVMHSMIILPALIYTLSELRLAGDQVYEYEVYRWFRSLKKACDKLGLSLDSNSLNNMDTLKVAQQLLDGPISKAIEYCSVGGEE